MPEKTAEQLLQEAHQKLDILVEKATRPIEATASAELLHFERDPDTRFLVIAAGVVAFALGCLVTFIVTRF